MEAFFVLVYQTVSFALPGTDLLARWRRPAPAKRSGWRASRGLMAWPTVCRSFLGEKEDDSSLPIGLWDHPVRS